MNRAARLVNGLQHEVMGEGKCGILILVDLRAAFHTVVHELLLCDCEKIGIEGSTSAYLKSYLENRIYTVFKPVKPFLK